MKSGFLCRVLLHCIISVSGLSACSLLYDAPLQCRVDSDCVKLSRKIPELSGTICEAQVCVEPKEPPHECESHSDCMATASSNPAICRDYACVQLQHGECRMVMNQDALTSSNDVILFGAFAPLNNLLPGRDPILNSYQLALDEITANTKGAIGYSNYQRRPFVIVACRSDEAQQVSDSYDHLAKTLKVPVIISNQQAGVLEEQVARMIGEGSNTMVISPFSADPSLLALKDKGRLWHMLGTPTDLAPAYLQLIKERMAELGESSARVLLVVNDVLAMGEIADIIEASLTINGLSAKDASDAGTYSRVAIESLALHPTGPVTSQLLPAVMAMKPNLIVMLAGPEVVPPGIVSTENGWAQFGMSEAPRYVLSHHLFNDLSLGDAARQLPGLSGRVYGVGYAGANDRGLYNGYLLRLKGAYPDAYREDFENYYDAAHFAMLSIIGAAREVATNSLTGDLAVAGFRRLIDKNGAPFDLTPIKLSSLASTLESSADATVYLTGTLGPPDFSASGARYSDATVWCFRGDGAQSQYASGVVRFERDAGKFNRPLSDCRAGAP